MALQDIMFTEGNIQLDTLPKLFRFDCRKYGKKRVAMRRKDYGIWNEYSWEDYYQKVKHFTLGLLELGMKRGDTICCIGDNAPEIYWAALAGQAIGGIFVGLYTDAASAEVKYIMNHSDCKFVVAEDQEQVDKILDIRNELFLLKKVIYWDPRGLWSYDDPILMPFNQVLEIGRQHKEAHSDLFDRVIDGGKGSDTAYIFYTSGTTGQPKGALLSHYSLISRIYGWRSFDPWSPEIQYVSFLSVGWGAEQVFGMCGSLVSGMCVNFPEEAETVQGDIREIGPGMLVYGARQIESIVHSIQSKIVDADLLKRTVYRLFLPVGFKVADLKLSGKKVGPIWTFLYSLGEILLYRQLKDWFGLSKIRWAYVGGSAISPDVLKFFHAIGVNLKMQYGLSESGGIVFCHRDNDVDLESSGTLLLPQDDAKISGEGEILIKSSSLFSGYHKDSDATRKKLDSGGWLHTGDYGFVNDRGHLIVIDRLSELMELSEGIKFSPQYIETRLRFSHLIRDSVTIAGRGRKYLTVLINIDYENVGKWAEKHHIDYSTFADLSQKPQVYDLLEKEVKKVNRVLPPNAKIKKFLLMPKELDADESELTRSRKLKREVIEDRWHSVIEGMYRDQDESLAHIEVKYQDGTTGSIRTPVQIRTLVGGS